MDAAPPTVRIDAPIGVRERLTALSQASGLRPSRSGAVTLVLATGMHLPESLNVLMVESAPHLLLRLLPGRVVVGPFVSPGVTACARCVAVADAEQCEDTTLALSHAFPPPPGGCVPVFAPTTWALLTLGMGLAARDLHQWHRAKVPTTWSATWEVTGTDLPTQHRWRAHPWCGCSWFTGAPT